MDLIRTISVPKLIWEQFAVRSNSTRVNNADYTFSINSLFYTWIVSGCFSGLQNYSGLQIGYNFFLLKTIILIAEN